MTIKQLGGVFGRNPTFNDVTVEGDSNFNDLTVKNLTVSDANPIVDVVATTNADATLNLREAGTGIVGAELVYDGGSNIFEIKVGNNSSLVRLAIGRDSGDVTVSSGNLIIGTSGKGIDFSATAGTGTSELFDDYEEGIHETTLTPSVSGTITLSSSQNTLSYTKIGRMMHVTGYLQITGTSSPVGYIKISLPTAIGNVDDSGAATSGSITITGSTANVRDYICVGLETENFVRVYLGDATTIQSDSADALSGSDFVYLSFSYVSA